MRVKIGDTWHSSEDKPIAVELNDGEREQIANMEPGLRVYAQHPAGILSGDDMFAWMADGTRVSDPPIIVKPPELDR